MAARIGRLASILVLLTAGLAGCIGTEDAGDPVRPQVLGSNATVTLAPDAIDESMLTEATYEILPKQVRYVTASVEGIELYTEVHLPDGDGPWPTILELSPYHFTRGNGKLDELLGSGRLVEEYVPRGYAVVLGHVRGTGNSEGCQNMMGAKEQQDAHDLVEWIAEQPFSDGKVGMHGVSYVGTTPHEAAIMAPEHLTTIVTVAGVTNQWRNTFQNGVPYDGRHYPITYEVLTGAPPPMDVERGPGWAMNTADGACGQEDELATMMPGTYERGIYSDYWDERNLTKGAPDVEVPILYSQGFEDRAVNPSEAIHWFNELDVPKKGLFHQAGHMYPPRDDYDLIEHAWLDRWLKGIENGVMKTPAVEVLTNTDTIRVGDAWPPIEHERLRYHLAPGELVHEPPEAGTQTYLADMARNPVSPSYRTGGPPEAAPEALESPAEPVGLPSKLSYVSEPLSEDVHLAGPARMHLEASVDAENTYFLFHLYDVAPDGTWTWLAEGWFNAHLREGFDQSAPLTPGQAAWFNFTFEPREWALEEGHQVGLLLVGHDGDVFPIDEPATRNTVHYGPTASVLELPVLEDPRTIDRPEDI